MIKINLLGEKVDRSAAYFTHSVGLGVMVLATVVGCFIFHDTMSSKLEFANREKSILDDQVNRLREKTKKVENLEKNKKLLSEKLTTIAKLKAKKSGPVHLLDELTRAVPERAWLTAIQEKSDGLRFQGIALDPQTVSIFMTQLLASKWIAGVDLEVSKQTIRQEVAVQEFALLVKLRNPLDVNKPKAAKEDLRPSVAKDAATTTLTPTEKPVESPVKGA